MYGIKIKWKLQRWSIKQKTITTEVVCERVKLEMGNSFIFKHVARASRFFCVGFVAVDDGDGDGGGGGGGSGGGAVAIF